MKRIFVSIVLTAVMIFTSALLISAKSPPIAAKASIGAIHADLFQAPMIAPADLNFTAKEAPNIKLKQNDIGRAIICENKLKVVAPEIVLRS